MKIKYPKQNLFLKIKWHMIYNATIRIYKKILYLCSLTSSKRIKPVLKYLNNDITAHKIHYSQRFQMPTMTDITGNITFAGYETYVPDLYVFIVKLGKCIVGNEEVFTKNDDVIKEITQAKTNPYINKSKKYLSNPTIIKGSVVNLSLSGVEDNYYHFITELLPRMYLIEKAKLEPDYYIYPQNTKFQKEFRALLNIDESKIINFKKNTLIQADEIIATSLVNNWEFVFSRDYKFYQKQWMPSYTKNFYKRFVNMNIKLLDKRIYISREKAKYRKVINETEVFDVLKRYGFEKYHMEDLNVEEQIKLFNSARIIIAPHGAGLANMSFCKIGVPILEIYPEYRFDSGMRILAYVLDHDYKFMVSSRTNREFIFPEVEDIIVDTDILARYVDITLPN